MILAIKSCHKLGFIHRDIKPDVSNEIRFPFIKPILIYWMLAAWLVCSDRDFSSIPKGILNYAISDLC